MNLTLLSFMTAVIALASVPGLLHAAPDLAKAKRLVEQTCSICHGMQGESSSEFFPRLGGQHAAYLSKQLRDFRSGRRKGDMVRFTRRLDDDLIDGLAQYFAIQKISASPAKNPELESVGKSLFQQGNTASGLPACADCHGPNGGGTPELPRLAGQRALYITTQLKNFSSGARANDSEIMRMVAGKLTELEVRALGEYIAAME